LIDFEASNKALWVDSQANKDYQNKPVYEIFKSDRFPGANIYYSPNPLEFEVKYQFSGHAYQTRLDFDLTYLIVARAGFEDYFRLSNRTWFIGSIQTGGDEQTIAVVDTNDNGVYQDPEDLLFIDSDFDMQFSAQEGNPLKKLKTIKLKSKERFKPDFSSLPEKLILNRIP
jgi:hypothetical protein